MRFADPVYLFFLLSVPVYLWLRYFSGGRVEPRIQVSSTLLFQGKGSLLEKLHRPLSDILLMLSVVFLVLALARPQGGRSIQSQSNFGVDIILVMDTSASMTFVDSIPADLPARVYMGQKLYLDRERRLLEINRLSIARKVIRAYIQQQTFNRIGIVEFASYSFTRSPLTLDKNMLTRIIDDMVISPHGQTTAIGMGISTAINRLRHSQAKSKVIILLTDGDNNAGLIDPLTAAQIAREKGIRIYTIGLGNPDQYLIPRDESFNLYMLDTGKSVNEAVLQEIANLTGGKFYRAVDEQTLQTIYADIDQLEKTHFQIKRRVLYKELFLGFALAGTLLLLAFIAWNSLIIRLP